MSKTKTYECLCGRAFTSEDGLNVHQRLMGCDAVLPSPDLLPSQVQAQHEEDREVELSERVKKKAKTLEYGDRMRSEIALELGRLRYVKMVPASHVDKFKAIMSNWLGLMVEELEKDVGEIVTEHDECLRLKEIIRSKADFFNGIETEKTEMAYLKKHIPIIMPVARKMQKLPSSDEEAAAALFPSQSTEYIAQDFLLPQLMQRLMDYSEKAREDIYESMIRWSTTANPPPCTPSPSTTRPQAH